MRLQGKVAIVTGGARGIGAGIARCLAADGAAVGIVDIDGPEAEKTAKALGGRALGVGADASDDKALDAATERICREFGGLDVYVNNAGAGTGTIRPEEIPTGPGLENLPQASWDAQLANNLRTTFAGCKAAIPRLRARGGGAIVNIASIAALVPSPQLAAYGAAKAGVVHLTRSLALELGPSNIRVNAICPGFLWTRAWEGMAMVMKLTNPDFRELSPREIFLRAVERATPLGREQTPEDIGKLVCFLASDDAANITGQEIKVDGGITLRTGNGG
ncbi:MAG TPA: SDR family NAD(P)-dependent oxidoreductase [Myxococcota bacterium]|nr:SDR family NAD(P)-dependent oxidoreductase [Myxococcota bacterium]